VACQEPAPALAVVNARVLTLEPAQPRAEAVLVERGRITRVGTTREVREAAPHARPFDAGGRTVVPGFVDGHAHFEMTCLALTQTLSCTTPPYRSLAEIAEALGLRARQTPPGHWLLGRTSFGLYAKVEEGRLFTRHDLDAVSRDHPIAVLAGLHVAMLNTRALHALGLWDGAHVPRGVTVHREPSGAPTGVATEVWDLLPAFGLEETTRAIRARAAELFVAHGVTSIHTIPFSAGDVAADQALQEAGQLPLRLRLYYHVPHQISLDALLALGLRPGFGSEMLRFGGVKIFVDGTGHDGHGNRRLDLKWDPEELEAFVSRAHEGGLQLWMHVNSQPAIRMAAAAVEAALRRQPGPHRHRLEHGGDFADSVEDMRRLRALGIRLVATPQFLYSQSGVPGTRFPRPMRFRTLLDQGFELIGGSDSTGTVPDGIAPLFNIACAVRRQTRGGTEFLPEERISAEEGLRMFSIWAATGAFEEDEKGSIAPGKLGDLAVLSHDPLAVPADALADIRVEATILGGRVVHQR
jgi:predicted amidohydrolase YtcJ